MRRLSTIAVAALFLVLALPAAAAEVTRESYKGEAEPICAKNAKANERILAGVREKVQAEKLDQASRQFAGAAKALKRTLNELRALPKPPADQARLDEWLALVKKEVSLFEAASRKLAADDRFGALRMTGKLTGNANKANAKVVGFEFVQCRFEPARFL